MNLIWCSKECVYQKEGACTLDHITAPTSSVGECCYYTALSDETTESEENRTDGQSPL